MDLSGKTAVVTGAGRGIGKSIALNLARQGIDVCVTARTKSEIEKVAEQIRSYGRRAIAVHADVADEQAVRDLVRRALHEFGSIDVLVNNAGVGYFSPVKDMTTQQLDAMWSVNLRGAFLCSREVIPSMMERETGDIINIASLAGRNAFTGGAGYVATKWALIGFSRCLMLEVRASNIRVITICPGSVDTGFGDHSAQSVKSKGAIPSADDIATVVIDTLKMPRNVMVSEVDIRPTNPKG